MSKGPLDLQNPPDGDYGAGSSSSSASSSAQVYSNTQGSFIATPNPGTKTITLSAFIFELSSIVLSNLNFLSGTAKRINSSGVVDMLPLTSFSYVAATGVLTLNNMVGNFAVGDVIEVSLVGPSRAYDANNDQSKVTLNTGIAGEDLANDVLKVEQRYKATHITTATTTVAGTGVGFLHSVNVNTKGTVASTITIYDNTSASGTIIAVIDSLNLSGGFIYDVSFSVGLTIVTTGTVAPDVTVSSR